MRVLGGTGDGPAPRQAVFSVQQQRHFAGLGVFSWRSPAGRSAASPALPLLRSFLSSARNRAALGESCARVLPSGKHQREEGSVPGRCRSFCIAPGLCALEGTAAAPASRRTKVSPSTHAAPWPPAAPRPVGFTCGLALLWCREGAELSRSCRWAGGSAGCAAGGCGPRQRLAPVGSLPGWAPLCARLPGAEHRGLLPSPRGYCKAPAAAAPPAAVPSPRPCRAGGLWLLAGPVPGWSCIAGGG